MLQVKKYDIEFKYKPGKQLIIADILSHASLKNQEDENFDNEIQAQV